MTSSQMNNVVNWHHLMQKPTTANVILFVFKQWGESEQSKADGEAEK